MTRIAATAALALALAGCAGTEAQFAGNVCGQPVNFSITDRKDRGAFEATFTCPDGGFAHVSTAESSTSAVIEAQARALATATETLGAIAARVAP